MSEEGPIQKVAGKVIDNAYEDLLKPSAVVLGESLGGLTKIATFYPRLWARLADMKYEEAVAKLQSEFERRKERIPPENQQLPSPNIVGPVFQALDYAVLDDELRSLFAALLASSMDKTNKVHPDYAEVIRRLHPDEARFLRKYRQITGGKFYDKSGVHRFTVYVDFRSIGNDNYCRGELDYSLLQQIFGDQTMPYSAQNIKHHMREQGVLIVNEQEYLLFPSELMDLNEVDVQMVTDHLIALGLMEFRSVIPGSQGFTPETDLALVESLLTEKAREQKTLYHPRDGMSALFSRRPDHIEYRSTYGYTTFAPTRFGEAFLKLCIDE